MEVVIRDDPEDAVAAFDAIAVRHDIVGKVGSDGSPRGLTLWGPPASVAEGIRAYAGVGVSEVMWVFRDPFDIETIERLGELRAALGPMGPAGTVEGRGV